MAHALAARSIPVHTLTREEECVVVVLVLDNGRYEITGGQDVVTPTRFGEVARAVGAADAEVAETPPEVGRAAAALGRPALVLAKVTDAAWPGPSPFVDPFVVRTRFSSFAQTAPGDPSR